MAVVKSILLPLLVVSATMAEDTNMFIREVDISPVLLEDQGGESLYLQRIFKSIDGRYSILSINQFSLPAGDSFLGNAMVCFDGMMIAQVNVVDENGSFVLSIKKYNNNDDYKKDFDKLPIRMLDKAEKDIAILALENMEFELRAVKNGSSCDLEIQDYKNK